MGMAGLDRPQVPMANVTVVCTSQAQDQEISPDRACRGVARGSRTGRVTAFAGPAGHTPVARGTGAGLARLAAAPSVVGSGGLVFRRRKRPQAQGAGQ